MSEEYNMERVEKYSKMIPDELNEIIETAPKDDIDWALIIYLFEYSNPDFWLVLSCHNADCCCTVGKVSNYFNISYNEVYERLERMSWWVSLQRVYGYYKVFNSCSITDIGIDTLIALTDVFVLNDKQREKRRNWIIE